MHQLKLLCFGHLRNQKIGALVGIGGRRRSGVDEIVKLTPEPPQPARNVASIMQRATTTLCSGTHCGLSLICDSSIRRELKNVDFKIDYGTLAKASIDSDERSFRNANG